jgi:predicted PurR-regulated permease PerM
MEINEILLVLNGITQSVNGIKSIVNKIPRSILPGSKRSYQELENHISTLEGQVSNLKDKINTKFPELSQLIRIYSRTISDIRIAGALSDKIAELYGLSPEMVTFTSVFANNIQSDYSRVTSGIQNLPELNVEERGNLDRTLIEIRDLIRDLKNSDPNNPEIIRRTLERISTEYSDAESVLSKLLNRMLTSLDPRS